MTVPEGAIRIAPAVFVRVIAATPGSVYPVTAIDVDAFTFTVEESGAVALSVPDNPNDEVFQLAGTFNVSVTFDEVSAARLPKVQLKFPDVFAQTDPPLQLT